MLLLRGGRTVVVEGDERLLRSNGRSLLAQSLLRGPQLSLELANALL